MSLIMRDYGISILTRSSGSNAMCTCFNELAVVKGRVASSKGSRFTG